MEACSTDRESASLAAIGTPGWRRSLARRLLTWFDRNARPLPWRQSRDPYRIWLSEVMLQQTQVATVIGYFERFVAMFPTVAELAAADEQQVLRLWEGLGYYRRARQLHAAARKVCQEHGGEFPRDPQAVRALPGVGRYTAGAVLSIAFDAREPILEANTIRVLSRLLAYRGDPRSTEGQRQLWQAATDWLPRKRAGAFNQALMELGSEVCTPRTPRCGECPVASLCPTNAAGLQAVIPAAARKQQFEAVHQAALVVRRAGGRVLLVQRSDKERWAGLWDFPRIVLDDVEKHRRTEHLEAQATALASGAMEGITVELGKQFATLRHGITRFRITLDCYEAQVTEALVVERAKPASATPRRQKPRAQPHQQSAAPTARWFRLSELDQLPMNVTGRKIAHLLLAQRARRAR
jgi:A/G-specific adenine glycosylase